MRKRYGSKKTIYLFALILLASMSAFLILLSSASIPVLSTPKQTLFVSNSEKFEIETAYFQDKLEFRKQANQKQDRRDEVIYLIQSNKRSSSCSAVLVKEVFRSAISLLNHCKRCDFDITLVVDEPIYSYLTTDETGIKATNSIFTRIIPAQSVKSLVFAAHKPRQLMEHSSKPYVILLDADIVANHHAFPESIFDMLHKEYE